MKSYSIFADTMVDMTYHEVEQYVKKEAVVLFPIAVIEEHGPHLPLGTDTYITYGIFKHIQNMLRDSSIESIIAPPFYWGINVVTGGFPGSFSVKVDTMKAVIKDSIECLEKWGFKKVYLLNMHGDYLHSKTIIEIAREIYESNNEIDVYDIIPYFSKKRFELSGDEPYILVQEDKKEKRDKEDTDNKTKYIDVHAGGLETSLMLIDFKELVDVKKARTLKSSKTTPELLRKWQQGGEKAKEVTPLGYCGDPSNISVDNAEEFIINFSKITTELIKNNVNKDLKLD